MATRVPTSPQRDPSGSLWQQLSESTSGSRGNKPQIYVHFEFGVSWTPSQQPRNHSYTYMSRGLRDQAQPRASTRPAQKHHHHSVQPSHFTRHVSPLTTNDPAPASTSDPSCMPSQYPGTSNMSRLDRAHERSSQHHQRGSSAPPPSSNSPWDSGAAPGPPSQPVQLAQPPPQIWKDPPSSSGNQNRSGRSFDVQAPWEGSSGVETFGEYHPDHDQTISPVLTPHCCQRRGRNRDRKGQQQQQQVPISFTNIPTTVPIDSRTMPTLAARRGEDPARVRELEALGSAMMTVDNGFESQWWYQGERENVQHMHFSADGTAYNRNSFVSDSGIEYFNPATGDDSNVGATWADWSAATASTAPPAYDGPAMPALHGVSPDGYYGPTEAMYAPAPPNRTETDPGRTGGPTPTPDTPCLRTPSRARNESLVVSPMTEAGAPYYSSLSRSSTTRSEELRF